MAEPTPRRFSARRVLGPRSALARAMLLSVVVLLPLAGLSSATPAGPAPAVGVVAIQSSGDPTPQGTLTVWMKLASTANVSLVYFQFCQITHPVCYNPPVTMTLNATNWYVGTTKPMSSYGSPSTPSSLMVAGESAGYNITIRFANNTIQNEPTFPNPFPSLTVGNSGGTEYVFEMSVRPMSYALQGVVTDSQTGSPVSGATVTVNPGGNSTTTASTGAYSFDGLVNGSYSLSVSANGYPPFTQGAVTVQGRTAFDNVSLSKTGSTNPGTGGSQSLFSTLTHAPGLYAIVAVVIAAAVGILFWARRRNKGKSGEPAGGGPDAPPSEEDHPA